ncbi:MAG: signal peptidase II [Patescibacteria group bacterium]
MLATRSTVWFGILIVLAAVDRIVKEFIKINPTSESEGFFYLSYWPNRNLALGLPAPSWLSLSLTIIALIIIIYLAVFAYQKKNYWLLAATTLILVGGVSNLIDRLLYGQIIDLIHIWLLPIFNLADAYLMAGLLLFLFSLKIKKYVS